MPIKPDRLALYPPDWPQIVARIKERDGNSCKKCGVADRAIGYRQDDGSFVTVAWDGNRQRLADEQFPYGDLVRLILIVLTCAHLDDPNPANVADENLAMLCQRCHNRHDQPMRLINAAATRRARKSNGDLFGQA